MKKLPIIYILLLLFAGNLAFAQKMYYTSLAGGVNSNGAIMEYDISSNTLSTKYSLPGNPLNSYDIVINYGTYNFPGSLTKGSDNNFYSFDANFSVGGTDIETIGSPLTENSGLFFRINPSDYSIEALHVFTGNKEYTAKGYAYKSGAYQNGFSRPVFQPIEVTSGVFYGLANAGGEHEAGGIFKYNTSTSTYYQVASFDPNVHGKGVHSPLIKGNGNYYYGVLKSKVNSGDKGYLYRLDTSTDELIFLTELDPAGGGLVINHPHGGLVYNGGDYIFGVKDRFNTTSNWGGGLYRYKISDNSVSNLFTIAFAEIPIIGSHAVGLIIGANAKIYIITAYGGANNNGTIIRVAQDGQNPIKIFDFPAQSNTISYPTGVHLIDHLGVIYGSYAGSTDEGAYNAWSFDYTTGEFKNLLPNNNSTYGSDVNSGYLFENGHLLCRTRYGGEGDAGSYFEYDLATDIAVIKKNIQSVTGKTLVGEMTLLGDKLVSYIGKGGVGADTKKNDEDGGLLFFDLTNNSAEIKLNGKKFPANNSIITSYFTPLINGDQVLAGGFVSHYNQYHIGMRSYDIATEINVNEYADFVTSANISAPLLTNGTVYLAIADKVHLLDPNSSYSHTKELTIGDYNVVGYAYGNMILASNNLIYGMTQHGSANTEKPSIFSINPATNDAVTVEYSFDASIGSLNSILTEYNGKLYGNTNNGGANGIGYIFAYDIAAKTVENVFDFTAADGRIFEAGWALHGDKLYTTSYAGGSKDNGTIVSFDPVAKTLTKLKDLDLKTGRAYKGTPVIYSGSLNEKEFVKDKIFISPNPSKDFINISLDNVQSVKVYNISGAVIISENNKNRVDISKLIKGIYMVRVETKDKVFTTKFLKD